MTRPQDREITMYGTTWCSDCTRSKRFLDGNRVPYTWINIDEQPEAAALVLRINRGKSIVPTIVFPDGSLLAEPSDAELGRKLGIA